MTENLEYVQKGQRILVTSLSGFIGQTFRREYKDRWWNEVLDALNDPYELPYSGEYGDLVDSLDLANCLRLINKRWFEVFDRYNLNYSCRAWTNELMGVRNIIAHRGQADLDQAYAERALDTMALLCQEIDPEGAAEIRELYKVVRAKAEGGKVRVAAPFSGLAQPASESGRGPLTEDSLLQLEDSGKIQKTTLSRKITYGGKTTVYPVYKIRLDALYYNDQNDRIATWISRYEAENGEGSLKGLNMDIYNGVIEDFIVDSNPDAIRKTQKNIAMIGQREPGVVLADGRIVDGNRRFTCLRRIQRETGEPQWFEAAIMDVDIDVDRKQIKLLELSIQHGEEKKVDYDLIDYAVGTYRDIVQTGLLTVDEYAQSANEPVADVKKRIEIAGIISAFLKYIRLPGQFHVARDYQVYSLFEEMMTPLKKVGEEGEQDLKQLVFANAMMKAVPDQRKFIRDIKTLVTKNMYAGYFDEQKELGRRLRERFDRAEIRTQQDVRDFVIANRDLADEMRESLERAILKASSQNLKTKPLAVVSKCNEQLLSIDSRIFAKMEEEDKETLRANLEEMSKMIGVFLDKLQ